MRKGIEKLIDSYNRQENATYKPYISYLRETELPLKDVKIIDKIAYGVGVRENDDLMERFISDIKNYGKMWHFLAILTLLFQMMKQRLRL